MNRQSLDEILNICRDIEELVRRLSPLLSQHQLLSQREVEDSTGKILEILDRIAEEAERAAEERFVAALARVNLRDERYMCMRVIDGDTLEVEPPEELQDWMRDVHVRLYGIDAPESNQEFGPAYTKLLEKLCMECADRKLSIVWERERPGTEYSDFPRTSFERGVGNVFIWINGRVLYVNALLAMLPHVSTDRNQRNLIRGYRVLMPELPPAAWRFECTSEMPKQVVEALLGIPELRLTHRWRFPICLCLLPREVVKAAARSPAEVWRLVLRSIIGHGCPYGPVGVLAQEAQFENRVESRDISPFDLPLLLASQWRGRNGG